MQKAQMHRIAEIALTGMVVATGCADREVVNTPSPPSPEPPTDQFPAVPSELEIDILFVIDNSGSMAEEQASLAQNFPEFISVLENIEGGLPSVHIGVVSTDLGAGDYAIPGCTGDGDSGILQSEGDGCTGPNGAFIEDIDLGDGTRQRNYDGTLAETFSCMAQLGTDGCGFEQQLEAMYRALNGSNPTNTGFLREDAFLAVIFVTDEDDCSARDTAIFDTGDAAEAEFGPLSSFRCFEYGVVCEPDDEPRVSGPRQNCRPRSESEYMYPVQRYVDFLKGLKPDPANIIVAGIIGNADPVVVGTDDEENRPALSPSCASDAGEAAPAVRIKAFLDQFPQRNTTTTICNENLSDALVLIAQLLAQVIGNPCLEGELTDLDPDTDGIQPECQVSDVRFPNTSLQEEHTIPHCDDVGDGVVPCWYLQTNTEVCTDTPTQLELIVERGGAVVPTGTYVQARCIVD